MGVKHKLKYLYLAAKSGHLCNAIGIAIDSSEKLTNSSILGSQFCNGEYNKFRLGIPSDLNFQVCPINDSILYYSQVASKLTIAT